MKHLRFIESVLALFDGVSRFNSAVEAAAGAGLLAGAVRDGGGGGGQSDGLAHEAGDQLPHGGVIRRVASVKAVRRDDVAGLDNGA